jgi:hypothetical protein
MEHARELESRTLRYRGERGHYYGSTGSREKKSQSFFPETVKVQDFT